MDIPGHPHVGEEPLPVVVELVALRTRGHRARGISRSASTRLIIVRQDMRAHVDRLDALRRRVWEVRVGVTSLPQSVGIAIRNTRAFETRRLQQVRRRWLKQLASRVVGARQDVLAHVDPLDALQFHIADTADVIISGHCHKGSKTK